MLYFIISVLPFLIPFFTAFLAYFASPDDFLAIHGSLQELE